MRLNRASIISGALVWATTGVAVWAWFSLPSGAGVPFNSIGLDGQRHVGVSREALWVIPFAAPFVWTCMTFAPRFMRRPVEDFAPELYDTLLVAVSALLLLVEATLVAAARDAGFDVMRPVGVATGVLLIVVGNYLGKARQNRLVGLKTPWTLADARVWDKTHRFAGRGMMLGGLALIGLAFVLGDPLALGLATGACAALPMLAGAAWSWRLSRQG
jgi:uncharacterized membrane protein